MYALFIEVDATEADIPAAREVLPSVAAPNARERGAVGGYWLSAQNGRGISVVVFDTEEQAKQAASTFTVGEPPMPNAPGDVKVRTVEVREVLASI